MKKLINIGTILIIAGIIVFLTVHYSRVLPPIGKLTKSEPRPAPPSPRNYTYAICDDAYKSDVRHDDKTIAFFDVKLHDGCFSGLVGLPKNWNSWQSQLLHNDPNAWVAYWWAGWDKPYGPFTNAQLVAPSNDSLHPPSNLVRLEGQGTLRFYCVAGNCGK
jgi:hypothetical protein